MTDYLRLGHLLLGSLLALGCSSGCDHAPVENDPTFSYVVSEPIGQSNGASSTYDTCELAGPSDTLVLARLETPFHTKHHDCGETRDYWRLANSAQLSILRQSGPTQLPDSLEAVWFFTWVARGLDSETPAGTTVVASIRQVDAGEWIVTGAVEVDLSQNNATAMGEQVDLPNRWSELSEQVSDTRSGWTALCDQTDDTFGVKTMNDAQFDMFVHDGREVICLPNDAGTAVGQPDAG